MHMYVGSKYKFAQSMAIGGLHVQVYKSILYNFIIQFYLNPCTCMVCIELALHLRHVVYPRTGPASEPGSSLVWRSHMRGCGYVRQAPLPK